MNKLLQNISAFEIKSLSYKIVFFKKGEGKTHPEIRYHHVNPIYPPPGFDLKIPGSIKISIQFWGYLLFMILRLDSRIFF